MTVQFDNQNYSDNRAPDLKTPFMAKKLINLGLARNIVQANIALVLFSALLIGASASLLIITKVVHPSTEPNTQSALSIDANNNSEDTYSTSGLTYKKLISIEDYMKKNINTISPVKATVGGKFFVTGIETKDGSGMVSYEDGHNAYVADFTYITDHSNGVLIQSFVVRQ